MLLNIQNIGEAARNIPAGVRGRIPSVDWNGFARIRDVITHQYFRIGADIVRDVARNEIPLLLAAVDAYLKENPSRSETDEPDTGS